jgi:hypothetical protein
MLRTQGYHSPILKRAIRPTVMFSPSLAKAFVINTCTETEGS